MLVRPAAHATRAPSRAPTRPPSLRTRNAAAARVAVLAGSGRPAGRAPPLLRFRRPAAAGRCGIAGQPSAVAASGAAAAAAAAAAGPAGAAPAVARRRTAAAGAAAAAVTAPTRAGAATSTARAAAAAVAVAPTAAPAGAATAATCHTGWNVQLTRLGCVSHYDRCGTTKWRRWGTPLSALLACAREMQRRAARAYSATNSVGNVNARVGPALLKHSNDQRPGARQRGSAPTAFGVRSPLVCPNARAPKHLAMMR